VIIEASGACGRSTTWVDEYDDLFMEAVLYSNFCKRLDPKCDTGSAIVAGQWIQWAKSVGLVDAYITGTAMPNLDVPALVANMPVGVPDRSKVESFERIYRSLLRTDLMKQNQTLALLRNVLLPRLLSGDLRITDAEKMAEEVI